MAKGKNITGNKYNMLTVIGMGSYRYSNNQIKWDCICDCGNRKSASYTNLVSGNTKSCGCLRRKLTGNRARSHGQSKTSEYGIWYAMRDRCSNPKKKEYKHYGGRGIKVCKRWQNSFENFISDMGFRPSKKHTLERGDNNKGYCKANCRWATPKEQARNQRRNIRIKYNGLTRLLIDVCEELDIDVRLVRGRLKDKWPLLPALTAPIGTRKKQFSPNKKYNQ